MSEEIQRPTGSPAEEMAGPTVSPLLPEDRAWAQLGRFVFYEPNGRIVSEVRMQKIVVGTVAENHGGLPYIEVADTAAVNLSSDYVSNGAIAPRPVNPSTLDGLKLTGLPAPCTITINGIEYPCTDSEADLDFDQPGRYAIVVSAWPYLDKAFTYENPAS